MYNCQWSPVTVVIEACYSGNFIAQDGIKSVLADKDRTIIVSASSDKQAKIARSSSFSRTFFSLIESNETISNGLIQTGNNKRGLRSTLVSFRSSPPEEVNRLALAMEIDALRPSG